MPGANCAFSLSPRVAFGGPQPPCRRVLAPGLARPQAGPAPSRTPGPRGLAPSGRRDGAVCLPAWAAGSPFVCAVLYRQVPQTHRHLRYRRNTVRTRGQPPRPAPCTALHCMLPGRIRKVASGQVANALHFLPRVVPSSAQRRSKLELFPLSQSMTSWYR